jgi:hypothetical protein
MLSDFTPSATIAVKNLKAVRSFYEGSLASSRLGRRCAALRLSKRETGL